MTRHAHFIERAKVQLDALSSELSQLERTVKTDQGSIGERYKTLMHTLWAEWRLVSARIERLSTGSLSSINQVKADAESHWLALQAVIAMQSEAVGKAPVSA